MYDDGSDGEINTVPYNQGSPGPHMVVDNVRNLERVAVGLPIDHDDDPSTPERLDPDMPYAYTENALREEWAWPRRPRY